MSGPSLADGRASQSLPRHAERVTAFLLVMGCLAGSGLRANGHVPDFVQAALGEQCYRCGASSK